MQDHTFDVNLGYTGILDSSNQTKIKLLQQQQNIKYAFMFTIKEKKDDGST